MHPERGPKREQEKSIPDLVESLQEKTKSLGYKYSRDALDAARAMQSTEFHPVADSDLHMNHPDDIKVIKQGVAEALYSASILSALEQAEGFGDAIEEVNEEIDEIKQLDITQATKEKKIYLEHKKIKFLMDAARTALEIADNKVREVITADDEGREEIELPTDLDPKTIESQLQDIDKIIARVESFIEQKAPTRGQSWEERLDQLKGEKALYQLYLRKSTPPPAKKAA